MPPLGRIAIEWRSVMRWCLLGTIVMLLWLLAPTAKCSWTAFRETPLPQATPTADAEPVAAPEEPGFFDKLGGSISSCYRRTPLFGQEDWKGYLLVGFAGATVLAWAIKTIEGRRKRTFDR